MVVCKNPWAEIWEVDELLKSLQLTLEEMKLATEILANAGWTIPSDFQPHELLSLVDCTKYDELDEYFLKYYSDNNDEMLNEVFREIKLSTKIKQWEQLIDECISCYKSEYCLIIVPSLLSIIEGILSRIMKNISIKEKKESVIAVCKRKALENECFSQRFWISMYKFAEQIFKGKQDFDGKRPILINRHWILHGRDETTWEKIDVIRLFVAMNTLLVLLREPMSWTGTCIEETS